MRRMKKARQYLLGIFAALLLCGIFSVNTVKADTQYVYDNASLLSDEEQYGHSYGDPDRVQQRLRGLPGDCG